MTSLKLREKGYQILFEHLGQIATIRFLQEFDWAMVTTRKNAKSP